MQEIRRWLDKERYTMFTWKEYPIVKGENRIQLKNHVKDIERKNKHNH